MLPLLLFLAPSIPTGEAKLDIEVRGTTFEVFTTKPKSYDGKRMILVFHGLQRDAEVYRNDAERMAERFGALIVAPKFDKDRFPSRKYQRGGVLNEDGTAAPKEEWTYTFVPAIAKEILRREGRPNMPYVLLGHSAGGQFLVRLAGLYGDHGAARIVAMNPGSGLFPTRDMPFGYGFGKLPAELSDDEAIRRYLAQPLTLDLGTDDVHADADLDVSPDAMAQGPTRYQRGKAAFAAAQKLAGEHRWKFGWRLVETPGVGHDHTKMFDAPETAKALGF